MGGRRDDKPQKISHALELDAGGVADLLEDLLAGLRRGELAVEHGARSLILRPSGAIAVAIRAKHKSGRESLRVELEWTPERVEPVLRLGPTATGSAGAGTESESESESESEAELEPELELEEDAALALEISAEALARLPKERLYALAKAVALDGRSQLPKRALARALAEHDLRPHLSADELQTVRQP